MSIAIIDYGSGNLRSAAKALEVANKNLNTNLEVIVTSELEIIKKSNKIILPGQGSFRDCYLGINKINGLKDLLDDLVLIKKNPFLVYALECSYLQRSDMNLKRPKVLDGLMEL